MCYPRAKECTWVVEQWYLDEWDTLWDCCDHVALCILEHHVRAWMEAWAERHDAILGVWGARGVPYYIRVKECETGHEILNVIADTIALAICRAALLTTVKEDNDESSTKSS